MRREDKSIYFRSDSRDHRLVYFEGDPRRLATTFQVTSREQLDAAAAALEGIEAPVRHGTAAECEQRYVQSMIGFEDPSGNAIEFDPATQAPTDRQGGTWL